MADEKFLEFPQLHVVFYAQWTNVRLSYIIPENLSKILSEFPAKTSKILLEMSKILQKLSKITENS